MIDRELEELIILRARSGIAEFVGHHKVATPLTIALAISRLRADEIMNYAGIPQKSWVSRENGPPPPEIPL